MSPLAQLIEDVRDAFRDRYGVALSYRAIAQNGGNVIKLKRIQQIATQPIKAMPTRETLDALARGLGVPYRVVLEKALQSLNLQPDSPHSENSTGNRETG